jgi:hypothetical protein
MTDTTEQVEARWAAAAKLADGVTDENFHKRRTRVLIRLAALLIGTWIVGVVIAVLFVPNGAHHSGSNNGPSEGQAIAQLVFLTLGLIVGVVGFIWAKRTGHYITRWRAVTSPLNRAEKKAVRKQIKGKAELDHAHLATIVAVASQTRRATLGLVPIYSALVLFAVATAIGSDVLFVKLLELVVSLLFVAVAAQLTVSYRQAGRFVDTNRGQTAAIS